MTTITDSLNALIEDVPELPMTQVAGVSAALVLMESYQQKDSLNDTEQAGVLLVLMLLQMNLSRLLSRKNKKKSFKKVKIVLQLS